MAKLTQNKALTLGAIFLMLVILLVQLFNMLDENTESDNDKFEITGAYFEIVSPNPDSLKKFYFENLNFYQLDLPKGDFIANDAVRIHLLKSEFSQPTKFIFRVNHLSRLFRKLIDKKFHFEETKHFNNNEIMEFSIKDPAGNILIFRED
jgi:hypothetical protein